MQKDIRFLLVFLIIAIGVLVWLQCYQCNTSTTTTNANKVKLNTTNTQENFTTNPQNAQNNLGQMKNLKSAMGLNKKDDGDVQRSSKENKIITSKIVHKILENSDSNDLDEKSRFFDRSLSDELSTTNESESESDSELDNLSNPLINDINTDRNSLMDPDQKVLDKLIREVNTGNDLVVDNARSDLYKSRSRSINSAKKYRKIIR